MKLNAKTVFNFFLMIIFAVLLIMAFQYNPRARLIPILLGSIGFILILVQGIYDAFPSMRMKLAFLKEEGFLTNTKFQNEQEADQKELEKKDDGIEELAVWGSSFRIFAWLFGFLVLLYYFGYLVAVPFFLFFLLWVEGKRKIPNSLGVSLGTTGFMYFLFEIILNSPF